MVCWSILQNHFYYTPMDSNADEMARRPITSCPDNGKHHSRFSIPLSFCLYFLTFTTILEIFRARHHLSIAVYILTFYFCLMLMIVCIHVFNRSPENSETKRRLKAPILILTTAVNVLFVNGVSRCFPPMMALLIWVVVGSAFVLCFYFLFVYAHKTSGKEEPDDGSLLRAMEV